MLKKKQFYRGVLTKKCAENMRQIYRRTPIPKFDFNMLLCNFIEITLRHWRSPVNLQHIFRTHFPKNTYGGLLWLNWRAFVTISFAPCKKNRPKTINWSMCHSLDILLSWVKLASSFDQHCGLITRGDFSFFSYFWLQHIRMKSSKEPFVRPLNTFLPFEIFQISC